MFYWPTSSNRFRLDAVVTSHVDDLVLAASRSWLDWMYGRFLKKFGKVKRQKLPFVNIGMHYDRTPKRGLMLMQKA